MFWWRSLVLAALLVALAGPSPARAQPPTGQTDPTPDPAQQAVPVTTTIAVTVVGTTPLAGIDLPLDRIPAPVQTVTAAELETSGALDVADFLGRRLNGVHMNETQGNPFQPDLNYRGYTASPLLGTPQGLSVFMDGVRLNQPFGEVVSWDLIPRMAIASSALMPGSNPLFGLNTLGGALAIQTKDGRSSEGTSVFVTYGSDARRALEFEHGGNRATSGLDWYLAGNVFAEDGWREDSPSDVRQLFGKLGWHRSGRDVRLTVAHADNLLRGNGLQEAGFLERDYRGVYTTPDVTDNRSTLLNMAARHERGPRLALSGHTYYRRIRTATLNGDVNEESLRDEPPSDSDSWANGLVNRTHALQRSAGASGQMTLRDANAVGSHQFIIGAAYDRGSVGFVQSAEVGRVTAERSVVGTGAFDDDTAVELDGTATTWSAFATDTLSIATTWHLTLSGRFNRTRVRNDDRLVPGGGPGSLDGTHVFSRFNPAAGVTFNPSRAVNVYLGYSEGSRAATSIELGCADPDTPCKLPNAMAGDPPLEQVVTRTWESGLRGTAGSLGWHVALFRAENRNDILFVASERTGFGYFRNVGRTRRQGVELGSTATAGRLSVGAGYTYLAATYQSVETVNGESNSTNATALAGRRGLEGTIEIRPGDHVPLVPRHALKAFGTLQATRAFSVELDMTATSSTLARGNENSRHVPDGITYLGAGSAPGHAVVNLGARYRMSHWLQLVAQLNNVLDARYSTAAQLGAMAFSANGGFAPRPLPEVDGEYPLRHATFLAPGAPRRAWVGTRFTF